MSAEGDLRRFDEALRGLGQALLDAWRPVLMWVRRHLFRAAAQNTSAQQNPKPHNDC